VNSGVERVLVGARNTDQLKDNITAFDTPASADVLDALRRVSDSVHAHIPNIGNIFKYYP